MVRVPFTDITFACTRDCDLMQLIVYIISLVVVVVVIVAAVSLIGWVWRKITR